MVFFFHSARRRSDRRRLVELVGRQQRRRRRRRRHGPSRHAVDQLFDGLRQRRRSRLPANARSHQLPRYCRRRAVVGNGQTLSRRRADQSPVFLRTT